MECIEIVVEQRSKETLEKLKRRTKWDLRTAESFFFKHVRYSSNQVYRF